MTSKCKTSATESSLFGLNVLPMRECILRVRKTKARCSPYCLLLPHSAGCHLLQGGGAGGPTYLLPILTVNWEPHVQL